MSNDTQGTYEDEPCWCQGECCSDIPLTDEDVGRFLLGTGYQFDNFALRTNAGTFVKQGLPVYEWRGEGLERMLYVLKFCYFLDTHTRLCRFYGNRASICRGFTHERRRSPAPSG